MFHCLGRGIGHSASLRAARERCPLATAAGQHRRGRPGEREDQDDKETKANK